MCVYVSVCGEGTDVAIRSMQALHKLQDIEITQQKPQHVTYNYMTRQALYAQVIPVYMMIYTLHVDIIPM